ncbi:hypothetical protein SAMN05421504_10637 [Amycolatopsis xylanica]|uniref:DUF3093 domain-containing protein n=1 Tax=Amycolatopsis xylanica TaxID=589385 RepID=A0A1H3L2T5_9PSEU|nr:hypothetical protein [Amycolatopsis xylanica]SDY58670.1 hypothetical protein SAMN05421504_10637 [Amycolatopsis xylanica]
MSDEDRYREQAVSWLALIWGPVFALVGYLTELIGGGPRHGLTWIGVGLGLALITLPWAYARRRYLTVRVTRLELWQGREALPLGQIKELDDVGTPVGARVLGGGWTVPRKYDELPIRLEDGTVVLAWAKDVEALRDALNEVRGSS